MCISALTQWYHRGRGHSLVVVRVFQCPESEILEQACQTSPCYSLENMLVIIYAENTPFPNKYFGTNAFPLCSFFVQTQIHSYCVFILSLECFLKSQWSCRPSLLLSNLLRSQSSTTPLGCYCLPAWLLYHTYGWGRCVTQFYIKERTKGLNRNSDRTEATGGRGLLECIMTFLLL